MSIQLFMEMEAFFLFALQYLVSGIEINYLFVKDEQKSAKRAKIYSYAFVVGTFLLLANSITYHVAFYNLKPISWIILGWMIVVFNFVFLTMMLYGLYNIRRAMQHYEILQNEKMVVLHIIFFSLLNLNQIFQTLVSHNYARLL